MSSTWKPSETIITINPETKERTVHNSRVDTALQRFRELAELAHKESTRVLTILTIAATAATLSACSSEAAPKPTHSVEHTASPKPTETATPTPEATTMPDALTQYSTMTVDQFNAQPKSAQREYAGWLGRDVAQFYKDYEKGEQIAQGADTTTQTPIPESSSSTQPQDVLTIAGNNNRYAFSLSGDDRKKWLIALYSDGEKSPIYAAYAAKMQTTQDSLTGTSLGDNNALPSAKYVSATGLTTNTEGEPTYSITYNDVDGAQRTSNYSLVTLHGTNGDYQTWANE